MPSVQPLAKLCTRCPYCDHVSPEHSKFCNDCGAALHLRPCPHCGALNDLTLATACGRCGGDMQADDPPEPANASSFDPLPLEAQAATALAPAPAGRRMAGGLPAIALLLLAGGAGAYYLLGERLSAAPMPVVAARPVAIMVSSRPALAVAPTLAVADAIAAPSSVAAAPLAPPASPSPARRAKPVGRTALPAQLPPEPSSAGRADATRPENKSSPCTEAVAALGLCSLPEAKAPR